MGRSVPLPAVLPPRHPEVEVAEFDCEFVVYDPRVNTVHLLSGLSAVVFDACDGTTPAEVLVDEIVETAALATEVVVDGVMAALADLARLGLLVGTEPPPERPCLGCGGAPAPRRRRRR